MHVGRIRQAVSAYLPPAVDAVRHPQFVTRGACHRRPGQRHTALSCRCRQQWNRGRRSGGCGCICRRVRRCRRMRNCGRVCRRSRVLRVLRLSRQGRRRRMRDRRCRRRCGCGRVCRRVCVWRIPRLLRQELRRRRRRMRDRRCRRRCVCGRVCELRVLLLLRRGCGDVLRPGACLAGGVHRADGVVVGCAGGSDRVRIGCCGQVVSAELPPAVGAGPRPQLVAEGARHGRPAQFDPVRGRLRGQRRCGGRPRGGVFRPIACLSAGVHGADRVVVGHPLRGVGVGVGGAGQVVAAELPPAVCVGPRPQLVADGAGYRRPVQFCPVFGRVRGQRRRRERGFGRVILRRDGVRKVQDGGEGQEDHCQPHTRADQESGSVPPTQRRECMAHGNFPGRLGGVSLIWLHASQGKGEGGPPSSLDLGDV